MQREREGKEIWSFLFSGQSQFGRVKPCPHTQHSHEKHAKRHADKRKCVECKWCASHGVIPDKEEFNLKGK